MYMHYLQMYQIITIHCIDYSGMERSNNIGITTGKTREVIQYKQIL
jgi:hypothetical protein